MKNVILIVIRSNVIEHTSGFSINISSASRRDGIPNLEAVSKANYIRSRM
jgi:hypothetical protein